EWNAALLTAAKPAARDEVTYEDSERSANVIASTRLHETWDWFLENYWEQAPPGLMGLWRRFVLVFLVERLQKSVSAPEKPSTGFRPT
ncbi:MAG: hypothetical protein CMN21_02760, partial [Rubinisphaera sp.]|nr:hypothetical protein [Rubinisphaera sp.]